VEDSVRAIWRKTGSPVCRIVSIILIDFLYLFTTGRKHAYLDYFGGKKFLKILKYRCMFRLGRSGRTECCDGMDAKEQLRQFFAPNLAKICSFVPI
jgi:hypothetical protein